MSVLLVLFASAGFSVFHFSNAQDGVVSYTIPSAEDSVYICPKATSLEEITPFCPGIIILKLGETVNGLTLTATEYEGQEYYAVLSFENGGGGEFGIVERAIYDLNNYIQNLPEEAFKNNPDQRKNALRNKLTEVFAKIENKEYQEAINKLQNDIREKADGYIDGNLKNDWIINPEVQKEICKMIDDLIIYLQNLL